MRTFSSQTRSSVGRATKSPSLLANSSLPLSGISGRIQPLRPSVRTVQRTVASVDEASTASEASGEKYSGEKFDFASAWYPLGEEIDFDKSKPHSFPLLGKPVVIWFDKQSSSWKAHRDLCPHRLIPLSEGRINERGRLECGYHGWEFSASGACEHIPQALPDSVGHKSERACLTAFPCAVKQGLIWVRATPSAQLMAREGSLGEDLIPVLPEFEPKEGWIMQTAIRDLPYDASTLLENVLDLSHVSFTHHGTIANRKNARHLDLQVTESSLQGFKGVVRSDPNDKKNFFGGLQSSFVAPNLMFHRIDSWDRAGIQTYVAAYATPTGPGRCRVVARFPFRFKKGLFKLLWSVTPRWWDHHNRNNVLEDDNIFLHVMEREVPSLAKDANKTAVNSLYYAPTKADAYVTAVRRWWEGPGGHGPFGLPFTSEAFRQAIGPVKPQDELMDRYHSHTKHCKACSGALKNFTLAENLFRILSPVLLLASALAAASAAAATPFTLALPFVGKVLSLAVPQLYTFAGYGGAAALLLWAASFWINGFKRSRFIVGTYPPPRNAH